MKDGGFYKMKRGWMNDPVFYDEPYTRREAFLMLIEDASYRDRTTFISGHSVALKRGQLLASERTLMEKWQGRRCAPTSSTLRRTAR